jgi:hypothetical protein
MPAKRAFHKSFKKILFLFGEASRGQAASSALGEIALPKNDWLFFLLV